MMRRDDCLKTLAKHRGDNTIAVCVYNAGFDWRRISQSPLNYYSVGAMGQGSSHALGIALAMPDHKVIVLDGDGSLLMNLGSLVTIAAAAPSNYYHFVCENGSYEANGSHPIPGNGTVSFAGHARAAGYRHAFEFDTLEKFAAEIGNIMALEGPVFTTLKVVPGEKSPQDWDFINSRETHRQFTAAIADVVNRSDRAGR
jgi:sulfopyruvate decarboxylase subunit beta